MAILKRALIVLAVLLLIPVVVLGAVLFYLTTAQGLSTIASLTSKYASSDDTKITIGGIDGSFPYDLTLKDVKLADRKGEWLTVDRARVLWSPLDLYSTKLTIDLVDIGAVKVARQPDYEKQDEAVPTDPNAPLFPELPIEIRLDRFNLADLDLAEPVIGAPARLAATMSAQVRQPSDGVSAEFEVKRIDGTEGRIGGKGRFVPKTNGVELSLRGSEPAGGLIARLAEMPGLPPVDIGLEGAGTLDALRTQLVLTAGGQGRIDGMAEVKREGKGRRITIGLDGDVGRIARPDFAELVNGASKITAEAVVPDEGPIEIMDATVDIPAVRLGARGKVDTAAETIDLSYDLRAGDPARFANLLPAGTRWASLTVLGTAKGPLDHPAVKATIDGGGLSGPQGQAETARIVIDATPDGPFAKDTTKVAAVIDAKADGVKFADDRLFTFGRAFTLSAAATTDLRGYADVARAEMTLADAKVTYAGTASPEAVKGRATVNAKDLSTLAPLVGQPLAGSVDLASDLDVAFDMSRLNVSANGSASGLATGVAQVDALTGGSLTIKGGVTRGDDGSFVFRGLDARGDHVVVTADGSATRERADAKIYAEVDDLALVDPRAGGKATVNADLSGRLEDLGLKAVISIPDGRALDKPLKDVELTVDATDVTGEAGGTFDLTGSIAGKTMKGSGRLATEPTGQRRIEKLDVALGSTTATGDVTVSPQGLATGKLAFASPDLSEVGALALTELAGEIDGDVTLSAENGVQRAVINLDGSDVAAPGTKIGKIDVAMTAIDPAGKLTIDGTVKGSGVEAGGQVIDTLSVVAKGAPDGMDVTLDANSRGSSLATAARVAYAPTETRIDLSKLDIAGGGKTASLNGPGRVRLIGSEVAIDQFQLRANEGGVLDVKGRAGERLDLTLGLRDLPLALGNAFTPGLNLSGMAGGDARVTGAAAQPTIDYDMKVSELSIAKLRIARVPPLGISSKGRIEGARVTTDTSITGAGGVSVQAQGSAPLGEGDLDMNVVVRNLPLSLANVVQPELGFGGRVEADARVTGSVAAPNGTYRAKVIDFTSERAKGVAPISVDAKGELLGQRVTTDALITGGGGVRATARGVAPLGAGDVDMTVDVAELPLGIANAFAPDLGLAGELKGAVRVAGPVNAPQGTYDLTIAGLKTAKAQSVPPLLVATKGRLEGRTVTTDTSITGGGGLSLTAKGSAPLGQGDVDLGVAIREFPLTIANAVDPALGLGGVLRGDVRVSGPVTAPRGTYALRVSDLVAASAKGVPALQVDTRGALQGERVTTRTTVTGGGVDVLAEGSAPIGQGDLDMDVTVRELPLSLANAFQQQLGLGGALRGKAKITGPVSAPSGTYDVTVSDLTSTQARGVPALLVLARGDFQPKGVTTDAMITGGGGIQATAKGFAPIGEGDLDLAVGLKAFPLALANAFRPDLGLTGEARGEARVTGPVSAPIGTYDLTVTGLTTAKAKTVPALEIVTRGDLQGDRVSTDTAVTGGGGLSLVARGTAPLGEGDLNMGVTIRELPLAIANNLRPELGLGGLMRGDVKLTGPVTRPVGSYDLRIENLTAAQAKAAPPLQVAAKGELLGERVTTDTSIEGAGGVSLKAQGSAPIGDGDLDMAIAIRELPLALANGFRPELGLSGVLRGDAKVTGSVTAPRGTYDLTIADLLAAPARGVPALQIATKGALEGNRVTTDTTVTGGGGIALSAKGSAPIGEGDLDMAVMIREVPLAIANAFKPELGLAGVLRGDAKVAGPLTAPRGDYNLSISGLTAAQAKGVPALEITTKGALQGERVTTDTLVTGGGGVRLMAKGSAPLSASGPVEMAVDIAELPLSIANGFSPGLGLGGKLAGRANVAGTIAAPMGDYDLVVSGLTSAQAKGAPALSITTKGSLEGQRITTDTAVTGGGGIRLTAKGAAPLSATGAVDMAVDIAELPLSIANGFSPGLGLGGKLAGRANVAGTLAAPTGDYDLRVSGLTAAAAKGVPALQIASKGDLGAGRVTTDTAVTGGGGLRITANGSAPIDMAGPLDVTVLIRNVPLSLANGFSPGLGANGMLQGEAKVGGTVAAPAGTYNLKVTGLSTQATRGAGVPAAGIDAKGRLDGKRVFTDTVVTAPSGLRVTARGSAPLGAGDLDLQVEGRAPLAFLNDTLSVSGDRIDGVASFDVKVGGPTSGPRINGTGGLANASYSNRASGLQLRGMTASIAANGTNVEVRSLRATTRNGGSISGSGRVAVDPARGFPGEINFKAANAEVMGTDIVTAITDADLKLAGPLSRRPVVSGTIRTRSVEIQIPDRIPAAYTPLPEVKHRNAPAAVTRQLSVVNAGQSKGGSKDDAFLATLDITVEAQNRIFIRGMGMTAEAGGQIKIAGTSADPQPIGNFELRPGRSSITVIGKRLNFTRGQVGFAGDLDPTLDFLAETPAKGITAQVVITGVASRPKIEFTSNPQAPQDEVLSRLLFDKSSGELTPSQAITLASTVAQYTGVGGGGGGPLESLRKGLGVDTLDIAAGASGPGLGVGRYISDNIYLGFKAGATPEDTGVTVDVDITKNIKARGEAGSGGNTAAGVAIEWDY